MFAYVRGTPKRLKPGIITVDVQGVGYLVHTPLTTWEVLAEDAEVTIFLSTYIREDRFDLYGFKHENDKTLFELFIDQNGIGPKLGLELLCVPTSTFHTAAITNDASVLTGIKGIGKKTGEKLLVELKTMVETNPELFTTHNTQPPSAMFDQDAVAALANLGYDQRTINEMLKQVPASATTTEERIAAALKVM